MTVTTRVPRATEELFALPQSDHIDAKALGAGVAETVNVPTGAKWVVFSGTVDFFAQFNGTATVPGDTSDGTASELNPTVRRLLKGSAPVTTISLIAEATCIVTLAFYKEPE